jgi:DNA-binding response OmpR family regulator
MARVLIVEDDESLAKAIASALTDAGFGVDLAANATQAYEKLAGDLPDLLYLDIMLPGESGYEILTKLRGQERTMTMPIVMLTNLGQMNEINRAMEAGATDYIVKANIDLDKIVELTKSKYLAN